MLKYLIPIGACILVLTLGYFMDVDPRFTGGIFIIGLIAGIVSMFMIVAESIKENQ